MPKPLPHHCSLSALFALGLLLFFPGQRTAAEDSQPPLYLEVRASVRGSASQTRAPFVPDITLHPGAQITLEARTSNEARVYMLHCGAHAALSIFPDAGGIIFRGDQWVSLPAADMPIQLGTEPGNETVYVLATRGTLAQTDARLERWLTDSMKQPRAARCGAELDALLAGAATAPTQLPPTAASPPPRKLPYAVRGVDLSKSLSPVARAFSETDGVVVLRFAYVNVR